MKKSILFCIALVLVLNFGIFNAPVAGQEVKMPVTAAFVSEKGIPVYEDIAAYLTKKGGMDVSEVDDMLDEGIIQVGYVCGLP